MLECERLIDGVTYLIPFKRQTARQRLVCDVLKIRILFVIIVVGGETK